MKHCTNCGEKLPDNAKFCTNCGAKTQQNKNIKIIPNAIEDITQTPTSKKTITKINKKIELENNQTSITKKLWYAAGFFLLIIIIIGFMEIIEIHPAVVFLSFFFFLSAVVIGFLFKSREEKLQKLISGEQLLAAWTLNASQKKDYANFLYQNEKNKNTFILFSIAAIAIIIFGIFILAIEEGKLFMFVVLIGLIAFLSIFAFGTPLYYRYKNLKNDGEILIGAKFAYVNGYFHNWDFPLSGIKKLEVITEPFYGLSLVYYYTGRTLQHSEELIIPANKNVDLNILLQKIQDLNNK